MPKFACKPLDMDAAIASAVAVSSRATLTTRPAEGDGAQAIAESSEAIDEFYSADIDRSIVYTRAGDNSIFRIAAGHAEGRHAATARERIGDKMDAKEQIENAANAAAAATIGQTLDERADAIEHAMTETLAKVAVKSAIYTSGEEDPTAPRPPVYRPGRGSASTEDAGKTDAAGLLYLPLSHLAAAFASERSARSQERLR